MSRVEDIRSAYRGRIDESRVAGLEDRVKADAVTIADLRVDLIRRRAKVRTYLSRMQCLEGAVREVEKERDAFRQSLDQREDRMVGLAERLQEAQERIAALEAEVAALRESATAKVEPAEPEHQYPRVEWSGGECPVPEEVWVHVELRYGARIFCPADRLQWEHDLGLLSFGEIGRLDILAYRIAPDSEQTPEGLAALREYLRTHEPDGTPRVAPGGEE